MGCEGSKPILQLGGVQDAMIVAAVPATDPVATPAVVSDIDAGAEELQVNGTVTCDAGAMMVLPTVSMTVAANVSDVELACISCSEMDCTGQVVKLMGTLVAVPTVA